MIVKMKKVTLLLRSEDRDRTLKKLGKLGVLHIKPLKTPASEDIQLLETRLENANRALQIIGEEAETQDRSPQKQAGQYIDKIISLAQEKENLLRHREELEEIIKWYEKWSAISLSSVQQLKEAGIYMRLYIADKNALKQIPADKIIHIAREDHGTIYFAFFSQSPDEQLDFKEEHLPEKEFSEAEAEIAQLTQQLQEIDEQLKKLSRKREIIIEYQKELEKRLEINRVKYGMGEEGSIAFLQGFCPEDTVPELVKLAEKDGWGYLIEEPDDPSEVPTLTRNPGWVRIIQPLFNFMGTLPGYDEQDVSVVFLAFFSLFYAMLVGDAGYGFVFLISTYLFSRKKKDAPREFFNLMYVLSFSTIFWGLITGTWFGSQKIAQLPFLKFFIIGKLDSFGPESQSFVMQLSFIIGVVHLSVARLLAAFKKINSPTSIAEIGWVFVLWAVFFVANNLVLGKNLPGITITLLVTGMVLVALFANFQKNILKGVMLSLSNLPLDVISSFSDVVSYIRLFAVGFATVIVASSFNSMAVGAGINSLISGIIAAIILFFGHSLNIALCGMSVLVHGVRLNMLEFSGHVGIQWTGKPYKPFKE